MILFLIKTPATGTFPTTTQQTTIAPTAGSYGSVKKISLTNISNPLPLNFSSMVNGGSVFESEPFIYDDLSRCIISGGFELTLNARFINEFAPITSEIGILYAAIFCVRNGVAAYQIGVTDSAALSDVFANNTLSFGTATASFEKCDRLYIEVWAELIDGGSPQNMSAFVRYNTSQPATLTVPDGLVLERFHVAAPSRIGAPVRIGAPSRVAAPNKGKC